MSRFLRDPGGRASLGADKRAIVGAAGDPCCCDGECPNFVRAVWCCNPAIVAWAFMNRPECPNHIDDPARPPIPLDHDVTLYLPGASQSCWRTDTTQVVAALPPGASGIPVQAGGWEFAGSCLDPRCGVCPGCCTSQIVHTDDCGFSYHTPACCNCGSTYRFELHSTSRYDATARVCEYCDGCRHVDGLFFASCRASIDVVVEYGCVEEPGNPGVFSRTISVQAASYNRTTTIGSVDQFFVTDGITFCNTTSVTQGPSSETIEHFDITAWVSTVETCGRLRSDLGIFAGVCDLPGVRLFFQAASAFDGGQCSGTIASPIDCGGSNAIPCCWQSPPTGDTVTWSGNQGCHGGTFTATGFASIGTVAMDGTVAGLIAGNAFGPYPSTFGSCIEATWSATMTWAVTVRSPCPTEPCIGQIPDTRWGGSGDIANVGPGETAPGLMARALAGPWGPGGCATCGHR